MNEESRTPGLLELWLLGVLFSVFCPAGLDARHPLTKSRKTTLPHTVNCERQKTSESGLYLLSFKSPYPLYAHKRAPFVTSWTSLVVAVVVLLRVVGKKREKCPHGTTFFSPFRLSHLPFLSLCKDRSPPPSSVCSCSQLTSPP